MSAPEQPILFANANSHVGHQMLLRTGRAGMGVNTPWRSKRSRIYATL